jgi:topoisomerase IA-like protein
MSETVLAELKAYRAALQAASAAMASADDFRERSSLPVSFKESAWGRYEADGRVNAEIRRVDAALDLLEGTDRRKI